MPIVSKSEYEEPLLKKGGDKMPEEKKESKLEVKIQIQGVSELNTKIGKLEAEVEKLGHQLKKATDELTAAYGEKSRAINAAMEELGYIPEDKEENKKEEVEKKDDESKYTDKQAEEVIEWAKKNLKVGEKSATDVKDMAIGKEVGLTNSVVASILKSPEAGEENIVRVSTKGRGGKFYLTK
jgi:uncharacterized small protein (DUF1192 family)